MCIEGFGDWKVLLRLVGFKSDKEEECTARGARMRVFKTFPDAFLRRRCCILVVLQKDLDRAIQM